MLDEPNASTDSDLPTPPRGRRAASRPAGPPKPVIDEPAQSQQGQPDERFEAELRARMQAQLGAALSEAEPPEGSTDSVSSAAATDREVADSPDMAEESTESAERASRRSRRRADDAPTRRRSRKTAAASEDEPAEAVESPVDTPTEQTQDADEAEGPEAETSPQGGPDGSDDVVVKSDAAHSEVDETETSELVTGGEWATVGESPSDDAADATTDFEGDDSESDEGSDDSEGDDSEDEDSDDGDEESDDSGDDQSTGTRRRRRRRGGRRRRRGGAGDSTDSDDERPDSSDGDSDHRDASEGDSADAHSEESGSEDNADDRQRDEDDTSDDSGDDNGDLSGSGRRRRRRRRRRGEDTGGDDDPDTDVVVKVREPRRSKPADEVTGIEGSTRMEAKRQRRREGRAAGRRRTPILSEAEFLARRESVQRTMVIRQNDELAQIAVLEDGVLVEHYVDRASATSLIGNVYLGRVQNVLPSMEAAFIDIGRGRNAVLYAGEVDWDSFGAEGQQRKVENVLKSGQTILVQVTKDPVGAKGARLTNNISLPGRYIVYSPGGHLSGISRKLPDTERKRLKTILSDLVGEDSSVIVRTAAEGASEEELVRDVNRLKAQWEAIEKKVKGGVAPAQLYAEPDATVRIVRDLFTEDFGKLIIRGNGSATDAYDTITAYVSHVAPHLAERMERWDDTRGDVFAVHRIDEQIAKALERKVYLPSGGSLVIDRTEAMTVIDVNTGKFTGSGGNLEATVTSNNLEAAEEVVRQLRLRDIGGIIVIDFIDMVLPSNRELLLRRLVECLGRDRTRHQVAEVTSLGLVQMTRKKIGTGLAEAFTQTCEVCKGRGYEIHDMPVESQSQADGGERRSGRRGRGRGGNSGTSTNAGQAQAPEPSSEPAGEKSGEGNTTGRSRRRRSRSSEHDHAAADETSSDSAPDNEGDAATADDVAPTADPVSSDDAVSADVAGSSDAAVSAGDAVPPDEAAASDTPAFDQGEIPAAESPEKEAENVGGQAVDGQEAGADDEEEEAQPPSDV